ncbi:hypothetical protein JCM8115_006279 [Rhodotorula mucilaginosa]|nr:hypothetical protein B0A53_02541 [Rhodotorula sp. CCFEE 5036]
MTTFARTLRAQPAAGAGRHSAAARRFASSSSSGAEKQLDWPTYLALRRSQRLYGLVASIPTTALGFSAGAGYFATIESDPTDLVFGVEPVYVYAAATLGCVALGWLAGPTVGGALWKLSHRGVGKAMEAKDKEFFKHVSRWRADPTRQSATNPAPDYYAEKVGSLRQYRSWLRDQNIFRRKAAFGEKNEAVY